MRRRTYLASAAAACLGGCVGRRDPAGSSSDGTPAGNRSQTTGLRDGSSGDEGPAPDSDADEEPEPRSVGAGTIDDFEDLSRWSVPEGVLSADGDRSLVGSQSARLDVPEGVESGRLVREFAEPIDLSNAIPGLGVAVTDTIAPWLRAVDEDGDYVDFRRGVRAGLPLLRKNFGVADVVGDPDLGAVTEIQIVLWTGDGAASLWCDDLHAVSRPETGKLMIQFDDAHVTDYTEALPILESHGYPAVSFVSTGYVDGGAVAGHPRLALDQLHELDDAGWTIANHTVSHPKLSELSADEQAAEIGGGKEWLEERGFERGARYFAYPFGDYDATTVDVVAEHHDLAYAGGYPVQGYTSAPLLASRIQEPSAKRARKILDTTAEMRGITSILYHRLEGDLRADFEAMVDHAHELVDEGDLEIVLPGDVEREYLHRPA